MYCRGEPESDEDFVERMKALKKVVYSQHRPW